MKIRLTSPTDQHATVIDTEHDVTITDPFVGPIFVNDGVCLAVCARDDGYELCCWAADNPDHSGALPMDAVIASIGLNGIVNIRQQLAQEAPSA